MNNKLFLNAILVTATFVGFSANAYAGFVDFESYATGTYNNLAFADGNITYTGGNGDFNIEVANPGSPISGKSLISFRANPGAAPFLVTFNAGTNITSFSIGVGDFNADVDNTYLEVYDSSWNLLASDFYQNPASKNGGDYLTAVTSAAIKYVKFWDTDPFAGAVYWDEMSYSATASAVPVPAAVWLFGSGLLTILGFKNRKLAV